MRVRGRVQGVGFRAFVQKKAMESNLSGWVRNRADGSVEFLMEGSDTAVESFLKLCHRGPLFSRVTALEPVGMPDAPLPVHKQGIVEIIATV